MLLEFKEVTKEYEGGFLALDNLSFKIDKGEFVFLVGASGAGKTTLVKLLIREDVPTKGLVLFEDKNIHSLEKNEVSSLRRQIGVVFQDFKLLESKTVFENVSIALEVEKASDRVIKDVVLNVLSLVGLTEKVFKYPSQLSGGEKQRVAIARALSHEPDLLVADEPTGMIDPKSSREVMNILDKINSLGTTILMATHDSDVVNEFKKRVITLKNGKLFSDKMKGTYNA